MRRWFSQCLIVLVVSTGAAMAQTVPAPMSAAAAEAFQEACLHAAVIGDKMALQRWLEAEGEDPNGLLAPLSPGARRRLLASLEFNNAMTVALNTDDLEAELTMSQAYRLLALFGWQWNIVAMPEARVESSADRAVDAWRQALLEAR